MYRLKQYWCWGKNCVAEDRRWSRFFLKEDNCYSANQVELNVVYRVGFLVGKIWKPTFKTLCFILKRNNVVLRHWVRKGNVYWAEEKANDSTKGLFHRLDILRCWKTIRRQRWAGTRHFQVKCLTVEDEIDNCFQVVGVLNSM